MKSFSFDGIFSDSKWIERPYVSVDREGNILSISTERAPFPTEKVGGWLMPGFSNGHSHAFQYAMAGFAEHGGPDKNDNFWAWRESMYSVALTITPEQMEAVAEVAYAEMIQSGYTSVVEFHYVHRDLAGKVFADPTEMSSRIVAAAERTGIDLTLVPVFYKHGNFDAPPTARQKRFIFESVDEYLNLLESCQKKFKNVRVGSGVHSLRAANASETKAIFAEKALTRHLHVAEQPKEVSDCLAAWGKRPIEWLLENLELDATFNLVHATHASASELEGIAKSGANIVLCPTTEANLGDGIFDFSTYFDARGSWCMGSDSQICLSPFEELRWIDYELRLKKQSRNPLCRNESDDSGRLLFDHTLRGSASAMGWKRPRCLEVGQPLSGFVVAADTPLLALQYPERRISAIIYALDPRYLAGTLIRGEWKAREGKHLEHARILSQFKTAFTGR